MLNSNLNDYLDEIWLWYVKIEKNLSYELGSRHMIDHAMKILNQAAKTIDNPLILLRLGALESMFWDLQAQNSDLIGKYYQNCGPY